MGLSVQSSDCIAAAGARYWMLPTCVGQHALRIATVGTGDRSGKPLRAQLLEKAAKRCNKVVKAAAKLVDSHPCCFKLMSSVVLGVPTLHG
jgi:hypothetical protein